MRGSRERGGGALNRAGRSPLDVRAPDSGTGRRPARTRTRVRLGYGAGKKMTGGPHLSATASEETARRGPARSRWADAGLLLGREGDEADEAGESEGLRRTLADGPR